MPEDGTGERESRSTGIERRRLLKGLGATTSLGALAGCAGLTGGGGGGGSGNGNGGGNSGDTQIDYWMYFGAQEQTEMAKLVEEFNSQDNGIHVNTQSVPFPEFLNKLFTAVNANNAPHIASYYGSYGHYLKDACQPIDQYLSNGAKSKYFETAWNSLQVEGNTYALPIDIHGKALYTNDAILKKAGVDPDFKQWSEFKQVCNTIKSKTDARPFSFLNWKVGQAALRTYLIALIQAGGTVLEGKPGNQTVAFDNETGMQTAELMASITGERGWDVPKMQSESARIEDFLGNELAMFIGGTWSINNFENESGNLPKDLDFSFHEPFFFPGDGDDIGWAESNSLYFPHNKNHTEEERQAAVKFAEYVTQNNTLWAKAGGHLPAAKSVATSKEVKDTKLWKEHGTISTMYDMVKNKKVRYQPMSTVHLNSAKYWSPFVDIYLGNTSVKKGVQKSAKTLGNALKG
ncbi:substrate-binding domain-containing protein [Halomicrococcus sp. NG-SE-24]|uniref:substrate-binding domain-containing protein n=1 Tax=Halomicrococcus sp. NG-SE-24 TaxID=3436928 RepID=UPI003D97BE22